MWILTFLLCSLSSQKPHWGCRLLCFGLITILWSSCIFLFINTLSCSSSSVMWCHPCRADSIWWALCYETGNYSGISLNLMRGGLDGKCYFSLQWRDFFFPPGRLPWGARETKRKVFQSCFWVQDTQGSLKHLKFLFER